MAEKSLVGALRAEASAAPVSGIEAVADYGRDRKGLIPLWSGESDLATPDFISSATVAGLRAGETFYTWQGGIPELRQSLARYHQRHFGYSFDASEFIATGGGMHAIQMAIAATVGAGDEALYLTPAWPNFAAAAAVGGATPVGVPLDFGDNGWTCDLERLAAAVTDRTRMIFVNSPSNPTGWTADLETLRGILDLARRRGLWIVADEIYALFHFGGGRAASFMDIMEPDDRILFVNTFSKNWAMTGWRIGWLKAHPSLGRTFENLVQYSTSGVAQFMQRGAIAALDEGDEFLRQQIAQAQTARDIVCKVLGETGRVRFAVPPGAFYLFFSVDGMEDATQAAFDIVDHANVGVAPGTAFGDSGQGFLRLCFHRRPDLVEEAAHRLAAWIARL
ncbi:MAG: pyridoxal phosphate-dependent aminotransferase [Rhizobiaceae bacterium]|nr:pyridoxal phosphate-dependent aminotransferase [Rhizobiaceae bacterium]